jgi:hypothetical protein
LKFFDPYSLTISQFSCRSEPKSDREIVMTKQAVLVFGLWLSIVVPSIAEQKVHPSVADLQIDAESIGSVVLGKKIKLMLHDGSYLEGKVLRAGRAEIEMRVNKSELKEPSLVKEKGNDSLLKTSDIGMVYLRKSGTIAGPVALGVVGGILGAVASAYLLRNEEAVGTGLTLFTAGTAGGATGGALLGREIVKKTVTIYVTPSNR